MADWHRVKDHVYINLDEIFVIEFLKNSFYINNNKELHIQNISEEKMEELKQLFSEKK